MSQGLTINVYCYYYFHYFYHFNWNSLLQSLQPQQDIKAWSYKKKKKERWKAYKKAFWKERKDKRFVLILDLNHT